LKPFQYSGWIGFIIIDNIKFIFFLFSQSFFGTSKQIQFNSLKARSIDFYLFLGKIFADSYNFGLVMNERLYLIDHLKN
jgi:hypothetical protein